jgi:hypothetical protein
MAKKENEENPRPLDDELLKEIQKQEDAVSPTKRDKKSDEDPRPWTSDGEIRGFGTGTRPRRDQN